MKNIKEDLKKQKGVIVSAMDSMNPRVSITSKQLPEVKDWKLGQTYKVIMELKQTGMHEMGEGVCADFEVKGASVEEDD